MIRLHQLCVLFTLAVHASLAQNCSVSWFHLQKGILTRPATRANPSPCSAACSKHFFSTYADSLSASPDPCFIVGDRRVSKVDGMFFNFKAYSTGTPGGQLGRGYLQHCTCLVNVAIRRVRQSTRLLDCSLKAIAGRLNFAYTLVSTSQTGYLVENLPCRSNDAVRLTGTFTSYYSGQVFEVEDDLHVGLRFEDVFTIGSDLKNEGIIYQYADSGYGPGGFM